MNENITEKQRAYLKRLIASPKISLSRVLAGLGIYPADGSDDADISNRFARLVIPSDLESLSKQEASDLIAFLSGNTSAWVASRIVGTRDLLLAPHRRAIADAVGGRLI